MGTGLIKIKVSSKVGNWIAQLTPGGNCQWDGVQFGFEDMEESDAWIVYEGIEKPDTTICPPNRVILILTEPPCMKPYGKWYLKQFSAVVGYRAGIRHPNILENELAPLAPFVMRTYDELIDAAPPEKTKALSICCSDKTYRPGNRKRYNFCLRLKEHFGDRIDWWGRGIRPLADKWDALGPYRYSVAIENSRVENYISEKFTDCILACTVPLYWGARNIAQHFPNECFVDIDVDDFCRSVQLIESLISSEDHYNSVVGNLVQERQRLLTHLHQPPAFVRLARTCGAPMPKRAVTLYPEMRRAGILRQIWRPVYNTTRNLQATDRSRVCLGEIRVSSMPRG